MGEFQAWRIFWEQLPGPCRGGRVREPLLSGLCGSSHPITGVHPTCLPVNNSKSHTGASLGATQVMGLCPCRKGSWERALLFFVLGKWIYNWGGTTQNAEGRFTTVGKPRVTVLHMNHLIRPSPNWTAGETEAQRG